MEINATVILLILQILIVTVSGIFFLISFSNLFSLQKLGEFPRLSKYPKVSILVPARNEEKNIKACIDSLLVQDYPDFEVRVMDDQSTDKTREILGSYKDKKLQIYSGKDLPLGWLGKHWTCNQLAEKATGELILFTDADTVHRPTALRSAVEALVAEEADFVSALPKEEAISWGESFIIPIIPWSLMTFMPMGLAKRSKRPYLSTAIGQFMLFKKKVYQGIGGYSAIRDRVLDDVTFGRRIKAYNFRWRMYDGSKQIKCRMYTGLKEAVVGCFNRCIFVMFKNNIFYFFFAWFSFFVFFFGPWALLLLWLLGIKVGSLELALAAIGLNFLTWAISNRKFGYSFALSLLHPVILALVMYTAVSSMVCTLVGKVQWKGRWIKSF